MTSRLPLRVRVAVAFALTTAVALTGLGAFVYYRVEDTLDEQQRTTLGVRMDSLAGLPADSRTEAVTEMTGESFAQVLTADGDLVATSPQVDGALLRADDLPDLSGGEETVRRSVRLRDEDELESEPGLLLLRRDGEQVLVVGTSSEDVDDALDELLAQLLTGGPIALLVATLLGYVVAGSALRPIERMRTRAAAISDRSQGERLPLPAARDEIHRLGVTLNEMLDRLDAGLQRERRFVAEASHELRTPLTLLRTELDLALSHPRSHEELIDALRSASDEVDRLTRLSRDLLTLASADEDRLALALDEVDLAELAAMVSTRFAALAAERAIEVTGDAMVPVLADRSRLDQVLSNLVDNALRHGDGDVTLDVRLNDGRAVLTVSDRGAGIDPELRDQAFLPFARGLGLSIVRTIVAAHGGEVRVADRPGGGTDVVIELPAG